MEGAFTDRRTLRAIAATLVALALLAERAAARSLPVRFLVLAILWRAERIARAFVAGATETFVAGVTETDWPCFDEPPGLGGSPADAALLALRLRLLAALLGVLAGAAGRPAGERPGPGGAPGLPALPPVILPVILPVFLVFRLPAARGRRPPPDTS